MDKALRHEGALQAKLEALAAKEQATEQELASAQTQNGSSFLLKLAASRWKCNYFQSKDAAHSAGCPGRTMAEQGVADPWLTQRIADLDQELSATKSAIASAQTELKASQDASSQQRRRVAKQAADLVRTRGDIERRIGIWDARKEEAERYSAAWRDLEVIQKRHTATQRKIDSSTEGLRAARSRFESLKGKLSDHYDAVLKRIISPQAEGSIEVDGDGMRPTSNDIVADSGTTLREYADVLSFDLSCLAASICGVGNLPRFWIHDSPRQADSEEQLYHSVLRFAADLEAAFSHGSKPSFQHIVTTTSVPAPEVNRPPFLRLRLHARSERGKLLKRDFGK